MSSDRDQCRVHKHGPTYGDHVCAHCGRFIPDASKVITAYHRAVQEAGGCTELTCIYHGRANQDRRDLEHIQRVMGWTP